MPLTIPAVADIGTTLFGNVSGLSIPVSVNTSLMVVAYNTSPPISNEPSFNLSGGIRIELE